MRLKLAVVAALFLLSVVADAADVEAGSSTWLSAPASVADAIDDALAIVSVDDPRGSDAGRWLPASVPSVPVRFHPAPAAAPRAPPLD